MVVFFVVRDGHRAHGGRSGPQAHLQFVDFPAAWIFLPVLWPSLVHSGTRARGVAVNHGSPLSEEAWPRLRHNKMLLVNLLLQ